MRMRLWFHRAITQESFGLLDAAFVVLVCCFVIVGIVAYLAVP